MSGHVLNITLQQFTLVSLGYLWCSSLMLFTSENISFCITVKVYKHNLTNEVTSKTQLHWFAGETQKEFSGFWVKIFSGERPPKQLVSVHNKKLSVRQVRSNDV